MRTKSMRIISAQAERIMKAAENNPHNERRGNIAFALSLRYGDRIIKHFGGYKSEPEFYRLYDMQAPRKVYAGY